MRACRRAAASSGSFADQGCNLRWQAVALEAMLPAETLWNLNGHAPPGGALGPAGCKCCDEGVQASASFVSLVVVRVLLVVVRVK